MYGGLLHCVFEPPSRCVTRLARRRSGDSVVVVTGGGGGIGAALAGAFLRQKGVRRRRPTRRSGAESVAAEIGAIPEHGKCHRRELRRCPAARSRNSSAASTCPARRRHQHRARCSKQRNEGCGARSFDVHVMAHVYVAGAVPARHGRGGRGTCRTASGGGVGNRSGDAVHGDQHAAVVFRQRRADREYRDQGLVSVCPAAGRRHPMLMGPLDEANPAGAERGGKRRRFITLEQVADAAVAGIAAERLLILLGTRRPRHDRAQKASESHRNCAGVRTPCRDDVAVEPGRHG